MKKLIFCLGLITSLNSAAQNNDEPKTLLGNTKIFKNLKYSNVLVDIGYMNGDLKNVNMSGVQFSALTVFNNCYATGLHFDGLGKHGLFLKDQKEAINPNFEYYTFNWRNEIIVGGKNILNVSFPLDLGIGFSCYSDDYYTSENGTATIVSSTFFTASTGLNFNLKLFKHISLNVGGRYRFASGVSRIGTNSDYTNYTINSGLRFIW